MTTPAIKAGWLAAQVGHRVGALGLLASCAGIGLMVIGKRPFPALLALGFGAAGIGVVASFLSGRWGDREARGLTIFNLVVLCVAAAAMVVSRTGHLVGLLTGGAS